MLPLDHPDRKSPSTTAAWWPMLGCSFRSRWPSTWVCVNWLTITGWDAPGRANPGDKMLTLVASAAGRLH